ncbi:hypothetical protein LCGC14_2457470 [marine sediment metagenome]|uniref:Uncharacterized protein n=1 Tax=marine sediment metagenome TaxID=412755 RepID=A0A0F9E868_9ZZZZ
MIKIFRLVIQTKKHYLEALEADIKYNEDTIKSTKIFKRTLEGLNAEVRQLKMESWPLKRDRTLLKKTRDLKLMERLEHIKESLQERNTVIDHADLDIVFKGTITADRLVEALETMLNDVQETGAFGRRVKKRLKSAVQ